MKRTVVLGVLAVLVLAPAAGQDSSAEFDALAGGAEESTAATPDLGLFTWTGDQELAWRWGAYEDPSRTGGQVDSVLSGVYERGDWKVVGAGEVKNNEYRPGETAVFFAPGDWRLGVGLQEFSWGLADKKNPSDTLNARDYRYGADAARLVNPAATLAWYPAEWMSIEAVYEPWKETSQFPKDFEANTQAGLDAARAALVTQGLGALLTTYQPTATQQELERNFDRPVYGSRVNFFLTGVDLSLSYVYDWDTYYTPEITLHEVNVPANALGPGSPAMVWYLPDTVELVLNRIHRVGLNAKTTVDRFGLWIEMVYSLTEDPAGSDVAVRNNKLSWTTGFDFNYGPASEYYLNLQYAGDWVIGYDAATAQDYQDDPTTAQLTDRDYVLKRAYRSMVQSLGSETEEWLHTFTASLNWPLADATVKPSLSGAVLIPTGYDDTVQTRIASAYFQPEIDFTPFDGVHLLFGAELAYGWIQKAGSSTITLDTETDKLGVYTPQNNLYIKVRLNWNGTWGTP